jgi:hypothetical protein
VTVTLESFRNPSKVGAGAPFGQFQRVPCPPIAVGMGGAGRNGLVGEAHMLEPWRAEYRVVTPASHSRSCLSLALVASSTNRFRS